MPAEYVLLDNYGQPWTGTCAGTRTDVDQPYGLFSCDRLDGERSSGSVIRDSIGYALKCGKIVVWNVNI
jgi:hypothetical protein